MSRRIDHYELREELARGGMGVVYRAHDSKLQRDVALKLLSAGPGAKPVQLERFRREVEALASLQHRNVVRIHASGVQAGVPYLVMDLVAGTSLEEHLARFGPLPERDAAKLVARLADALAHCHERGILHRDIKPGNVLLDPQGVPLLTDFGLARLDSAEQLTQTGTMLGTPGFAAPEQLTGLTKEIGPATDVWGLGALLFALLTGEPPFSGPPLSAIAQTIQGRTPRPSRLRAGLGPWLDSICMRCLEKRPEARLPLGSLSADLERFLRGDRPPKASCALRLGVVATCLVAGLLAGLGLTRLRTSASPAPAVTSPPSPSPSESPPAHVPPSTRTSWPISFSHPDGIVRTFGRFFGDRRALSWSLGTPTLVLWDLSTPAEPKISETWTVAETPQLVLGVDSRSLIAAVGGELLWIDTTDAVVARGGGVATRPGIKAMAIAREGDRVAVAYGRIATPDEPDGVSLVEEYDLPGFELIATHRTRDGDPRKLTYLPGRQLLLALAPMDALSGDTGGGVWSATGGEPMVQLLPLENSLKQIVADASGQRVWLADGDGRVMVLPFPIPAGALPEVFVGPRTTSRGRLGKFGNPLAHSGPVLELVWTRDAEGEWLYSISAQGDPIDPSFNELRAWRADGEPAGGVLGWPSAAGSLDVSPDGAWLLLGFWGRDGRLLLFPTSHVRRRLVQHAELRSSGAKSPR